MLLPFLNFPAEIRNTIYRMALVTDPADVAPVEYHPSTVESWVDDDDLRPYRGLCTIIPDRRRYYCGQSGKSFIVTNDSAAKTTLAQPALTRTCRQIRAEALPLYYSENSFKLAIPPDGRGDRKDEWFRFVKMMRAFSESGSAGKGTSCLRFIRRISAEYVEEAPCHGESNNGWTDRSCTLERKFELGFKSVPETARHNDTNRIGNDNLNWKDGVAVKKAFRKALGKRWRSHTSSSRELKQNVPFGRIAEALCMIGRECPQAAEWFKVTCLCPDDYICWKDWKPSCPEEDYWVYPAVSGSDTEGEERAEKDFDRETLYW